MERKRKIAVIECFEEIPCNPCAASCPQKAIIIEGGIHHIPHLDVDKCVGCGICVAKCSGQAIFVVDEEKGEVSVPYELCPIPKVGMKVAGTGRTGEIVCEGRIKKVNNAKAFDCTCVVTLSVPKECLGAVRGFRYLQEEM